MRKGFTDADGDVDNELTSTPLAANGTYTQDGQDRMAEANPTTYVWMMSQSNVAGTLYLDISEDNNSWTNLASAVASAGVTTEISPAKLTKRYYRARYVNGANAQASFLLVQGMYGSGTPESVLGATPADIGEGIAGSGTQRVAVSGTLETGQTQETGATGAMGLLSSIKKFISAATTSLGIMDDWDSADRCKIVEVPIRGTIINHRVAVVTADKVVSPTLVTLADQTGQAGSLTAVSHGVCVTADNAWGNAGKSNILTATPTVNKSLDLTLPQAAGATKYQIFCGTSTTAPPWVAEITEAQRAAGCQITAVGTVVSTPGPGGAGKVNIQVVGTGLACTDATFAQNNAYRPNVPTAIDCTGAKKAKIHVKAAPTAYLVAPLLNIVPFLSKNEATPTDWYQGKQQILQPEQALGYSCQQGFDLDIDGAKGLVVLIGSTTVPVSVDVELC